MTKSIKKANIIAAICFLIGITSSLIEGIYSFQYDLLFIIKYAILIALPVTLFTNKRKAFVFAAGASALWYLYCLIGFYFSSFYLFFFLAYACLTVLVILAIKKNRAARKLWFLPFAFFLTSVIIYWSRWGLDFFSYIAYAWSAVLAHIAEVLALVFAGIWNRDFSLPQAAKDHISLSNETGYENTFSAAGPEDSLNQQTSVIGGADKIRMYKELLDSGVITQDEFDAKKKQILGL